MNALTQHPHQQSFRHNQSRLDRADFGQKDLLVDILADAFRNDPVMGWTCHRQAYKPFAFNIVMPIYLPYGHCYLDSEHKGATVWLPPGAEANSPVSLPSVLHGLFRFGPPACLRAVKVVETMEKYHPKEPHYYLFAIGTRQFAKGTGLGSMMIRDMLDRCDDMRMPAYLENSNEANLGFYQKHGFEVTGETRFGKSGPKMWFMWREPRA